MRKHDDNNLATLVEALKTNCLFSGLSEEKLFKISAIGEEEHWPKKTCNIIKNRLSQRFYFILRGRLKMYRIDPESGREFTLFLLKKNDVFDVIGLLEGKRHEVFYETIDKVQLFSLPMQVMRNLLKEYPEINACLLPYLGRQMHLLEEYATSLTLSGITTRLARLFLSNINEESGELENINDLSNDELACLIGSTRAVVNRHLQEFKSEGILSLGREKLRVQNLELLLHKAQLSRG